MTNNSSGSSNGPGEYQPSLRRLADLASSRASLMSSLMLLYREQEKMDDEQLADFLGCELEVLPRLALCRRPRPAPRFREDVEAIAGHTGADPSRLARLVRAAEAAEGMRTSGAHAHTASVLMAARDREDDEAGEDTPTRGGETERDDSH
jgi:hypothetical protein